MHAGVCHHLNLRQPPMDRPPGPSPRLTDFSVYRSRSGNKLAKHASYTGQYSPGIGSNGPGYSPQSSSACYVYAPPRARKQPAFRFNSSRSLFAGDWGAGLVALGSFNEDPNNGIQVLSVQPAQTGDPSFAIFAETQLKVPPTKLSWDRSGSPRLLSSGDSLRLWHTDEPGKLNEMCMLTKRNKTDTPAPLTSFSWSVGNPAWVITASIDTTCTVWDLNTQAVTSQLIAHDREVYDVAFLPLVSPNQFVSVGADGSARLFDLRALDSSTIIYETKPSVALLRVAPSLTDSNIICVFGQESRAPVVLDIRATRNPLRTLEGHHAPVNCMQWVPHFPGWLATGADDCQVLVWDVMRGSVVACYNDSQQVNNVLASPDGQWLGSITSRALQAVNTQF